MGTRRSSPGTDKGPFCNPLKKKKGPFNTRLIVQCFIIFCKKNLIFVSALARCGKSDFQYNSYHTEKK